MKTIIINLQRSTDRRKHVIDQLSRTGWNYSFSQGVDGGDLQFIPIIENRIVQVINPVDHKDYMYDLQRRLNGQTMGRGEIGCYLSHLSIYRQLVDDPVNESYLIMEDDVKLNVDLHVINDE